MKIITKSVFISLLLTSSAFAYIPDIFSAYEQGREEAARQNYRDAERYQYLEQQRRSQPPPPPTFSLNVYTDKTGNLKKNKVVSLKKADQLCWVVYNVPNNPVFESIEVLTLPIHSQKQFNGNTTNNTISKYRTNNNELVVRRKLSSQQGLISSCWTFESNVDKGTYEFKLQVGSVQFPRQTFYIVD